ncbi:hypothetical protein ABK040_004185 [Willaertia magna]
MMWSLSTRNLLLFLMITIWLSFSSIPFAAANFENFQQVNNPQVNVKNFYLKQSPQQFTSQQRFTRQVFTSNSTSNFTDNFTSNFTSNLNTEIFFCNSTNNACQSLCQIIDYLNDLNDNTILANIYLLNNYIHQENCNKLLASTSFVIDGKNFGDNFLFQNLSPFQTEGKIWFNHVMLKIETSKNILTNYTTIEKALFVNQLNILMENTIVTFIRIEYFDTINFYNVTMSNVKNPLLNSYVTNGNVWECNYCKVKEGGKIAFNEIKEINFKNIEIINPFDYTFTTYNCKDINIKNSILYSKKPFVIIKSTNILFENVISRNGQIDIWISENVKILKSKFMESDLYSLRVTDVFRLNLENCNFYQNINPLIIINTYMNKIDISIVKCLFENNFSLQNGGAILIRGESAVYESTLLIDNVKFIKNVAKQNGGALYVDLPMKIITINNCEFSYNKIDNKNLQQQQIVTQNEIGNGGAIYLNGIQYLVEFYNTIAFNNSAIRGGVIYTNSPIELNKENFFYNNEANCGGVLFSNNLKNLQKINNSGISNNLGIYYGNNVASFASFINFTINNDTIEIYPGQEFTIEITTFDLMNQEIKFLNEPFTKSEFLNNNFKLETLNSANGIYKFKILQSLNEEKLNLENLNQIKFNTLHSERILNIIVKDCPNNFIKDEQFNYFICKRKEFPLSVIIIISVISSSILSIFLFIIFTYCCINITTKLRKLKLKENAEKDIERKILDNKIVFGVSSSSSYSTTTQQSSSLDTPLLQQSDENNYNKDIYTTNNSSTIKKKLLKSFIIPVEQIKIEKKIGEGGCGTVYLATWGANKVAIKSIKLTTEEDDNEENNNEDFEREVTLLSQLRHPNIVTFFGVTITEYSKYMVIEYLKI